MLSYVRDYVDVFVIISAGDIAIRRVCWYVCLFVFVCSLTCIGAKYLKRKRLERLGSNILPIGNGIWRIEWSRDQ